MFTHANMHVQTNLQKKNCQEQGVSSAPLKSNFLMWCFVIGPSQYKIPVRNRKTETVPFLGWGLISHLQGLSPKPRTLFLHHHREKQHGMGFATSSLFIMSIYPFMKMELSWPTHLPSGPQFNFTTLGIKFLTLRAMYSSHCIHQVYAASLNLQEFFHLI